MPLTKRSKRYAAIKVVVWFFAGFQALTSFVSADDPEQKFQGFNLQGYTDTGEKAWDVTGETADIMGTTVSLSNVRAKTYGKEEVKITADRGTIDQASGNMLLEEDVFITSQRGTQLMTDSLNWNKNKDLVSTSDEVTIVDKGLTVTGKGMNAHPGLKNAEIKEDVTMRVDPDQVGDK